MKDEGNEGRKEGLTEGRKERKTARRLKEISRRNTSTVVNLESAFHAFLFPRDRKYTRYYQVPSYPGKCSAPVGFKLSRAPSTTGVKGEPPEIRVGWQCPSLEET
ncbi:hypothetical protein CEXT_727951 [Caerostris extrusa]|uniref:Uncharacterized protein n=1 Tax=Caerostris extrusa TaxID=172846 RepID=A0AAV4MFG3_CAEEX|nr:hypothetical protein CEXT_727951 [Caerostris extrusa]